MSNEVKVTQLHILRDCLSREQDIDKAVETFINDYAHKNSANLEWREWAEKIRADETVVEQYEAELRAKQNAPRNS